MTYFVTLMGQMVLRMTCFVSFMGRKVLRMTYFVSFAGLDGLVYDLFCQNLWV